MSMLPINKFRVGQKVFTKSETFQEGVTSHRMTILSYEWDDSHDCVIYNVWFETGQFALQKGIYVVEDNLILNQHYTGPRHVQSDTESDDITSSMLDLYLK